MKNILGKEEDLELFDEKGRKVYMFWKNSDGFSCESTYDSNGNELTYKDSDGYWFESTYDSNGNELTMNMGKKEPNGKELTFKDSDGVTRGF